MRRQPLEPFVMPSCRDRSAETIANFHAGFVAPSRVEPILDVFPSQRVHGGLQRLVVKELKMRRILERVVPGKLLKAPFHGEIDSTSLVLT